MASKVLTVAYEVVVVYERFELQGFVGKILVFWIDRRIWGMVAYMGWSHIEV